VLEIGAGTGLNLAHYPASAELTLTEPVAAMRMAARIDTSRFPGTAPVRLLDARAEALPFPDASFDELVAELPWKADDAKPVDVAEARRVLRPGGRLLFLEHVAAEPGWRRSLQRRSVRPWAAFADGCRCDRQTLETIAGEMQVESVNRATWRGMPPIVKPLVWGRAVGR